MPLQILLSILADIITDLSAASFAAIWIVPVFSKRSPDANTKIVLINSLLGLAGLAVVWVLRTLGV